MKSSFAEHIFTAMHYRDYSEHKFHQKQLMRVFGKLIILTKGLIVTHDYRPNIADIAFVTVIPFLLLHMFTGAGIFKLV